MSNLPSAPNQPQRDPAIIERGPIEPSQQAPLTPSEREYLDIIGHLASKLEQVESERDRLQGISTVEQARARLMAPFSTGVFRFVVGYCVAVFVILLLMGFPLGFKLPENVLVALVSGTGLSVIGLIGTIAAGLFSRK